MKLIKESIDYEVYNPNEEEVERFIDAHIPPCNSIALRISELFPGKKPSLELELAIQQKIKEDIISTLQEFSIPEAEAINYLEIVLEEMKEELIDKLVDVVVEEEPAVIAGKEEPKLPEEVAVEVVEEAVQVKYFRLTYKHETGIYSTAAIEADTYDKAVEEFNKSGKGELIDCSPISEEEFKDLIDSGISEIGKESLTEELNVNVDTDQSNINVSAEEDAAVEIKVDPKDCVGEECDAEAELAELAKDPKYAKAFAYLMNTLQGEDEVITEPTAEVAEEPVTELVESSVVKDTTALKDGGDLSYRWDKDAGWQVIKTSASGSDGLSREEFIKTYPNEDAAKKAYSKYKKLYEDLEEVKLEEEPKVPTEEPPKEPEDLYVANTLNDLIKGELDTINQYNDLILGIQGMTEAPKDEAGNPDPNFTPMFCPEKAAEIKEVIKDILVEENKHIGQLQELLKKVSPNAENIEAGAEEAKEQAVEASEEVAE